MQDIGNSFIILDSVESTNNYAMARAHEGLAKHGDAYFTYKQTSGKGQRGKTWFSQPGQNIVMSLVFTPDPLLNSRKFLLSAAIALGCHDFFSSLAGDETKIKWPNDIYWNDRKAGGILIENLIHAENWKFAIVGIGININQTAFPENLIKAVSLKQITGRDWDVVAQAKALCSCINKRYVQALEQADILMSDYVIRLYKLNQMVKLKYQNILFETIIQSVSIEGKLITANALKDEFSIGEVEWI